MIFNQQNSNQLLIKENSNYTIISFDDHDQDQDLVTKQINTTTNNLIYLNNTVIQYQSDIIEIVNLTSETFYSINASQQISLLRNQDQIVKINKIHAQDQYHVILVEADTVSKIRIFEQSISQFTNITFQGEITESLLLDDYLYVIQQIGSKLNNSQFLLEIEVNELKVKQNLTLSTQVKQLFVTKQFILVLQENIMQLAFAKIDTKQFFSKVILENTNRILSKLENQSIIVLQQDTVTAYEIVQQSAELICEPQLNDQTGIYQLELQIGYFNNDTLNYTNQTIEFNVYREIFENGNVGLYVGLSIGLACTFIVGIIFCVFFYKIKSKYEHIDEYSQNENDYPDITKSS